MVLDTFIRNIRRYGYYAAYSAFASLRSAVSGSYLSWLWWILEPFFFMLIYSFVSIIVFGKSEPYFPVFVFLGLSVWNFINRSLMACVKGVRANKSVVSRVYIPKYILVLSKLLENLFHFGISLALTFLLAFLYRVPLTWTCLYIPVIMLVMFALSFGVCCVFLHMGVYVQDLVNLTNVGMRLFFYLSGIFYSIPKRVPQPYGPLLLTLNPVSMLINEMRNVFLYGQAPNGWLLAGWMLVSVGISAFGVYLIQKYEQNYVKAI